MVDANRSHPLRLSAGPCKRLTICAAVVLLLSSRAHAEFIQGIDISHWQGSINWTAVKNAGIKFAFMKATEGTTYTDPTFSTNIQNATAAGVLVGPYHFCRLDTGTTNPQDPVNEANHFISRIMPYYQSGLYLPPVADVEGFPPFGSTAEAQAFTSNWVQIFSDTINDALGVRPIIYTSKSKANSYYTPAVASTHELWLAWWKGTGTTSPPVQSDTPLWDPWKFWQWTDSWSVPGVAGNVDGDVFSGTMQQLTALLVDINSPPMLGDFNTDGVVDAADYVVWRRLRGQRGGGRPVDANRDNVINDEDYAI